MSGGIFVSALTKNGKLFNKYEGKGLIKLDDDVANMFEKAKTVKESRIGKIMLESTLFHEGTHFGNAKTTNSGNGNLDESGKEFEKSVYGQDINRLNVQQQQVCRNEPTQSKQSKQKQEESE